MEISLMNVLFWPLAHCMTRDQPPGRRLTAIPGGRAPRRKWHAIVLVALGWWAAPGGHGLAAEYPVKPVRLVVPFAPGGGTDLFARVIANQLSETWRQSVVVDNRAGGGGTIGTATVAKSVADGYTLLFATPSVIAVAPALYPRLPYDPVKEFAPVIEIAYIPQVLSASPSVGVKDFRDFVQLAKSRPGHILYGTAGTGSASHMAMALFQSVAQISVTHVPYKGTGPAMIDLLGGHVSVMFDIMNTSLPLYKAGKINSLAVTSPARAESMPKVPTIAESGYPGFETLVWFGLFVPASVPPQVIAQLHRDVARILDTPKLRDLLAEQGMVALANGPAKFNARVVAEIVKWRNVVNENRIRVE